MQRDFILVDTEESLKKSVEEIIEHDVVGIDIECENNLHHYGVKVAIIQMSTKNKNYVFDTIILKEIKPLKEIFENSKIKKIFHDVSFDLRMLKTEFDFNVKNIYDTQLASSFLGSTQISLGELLHNNFNVEKEHKFQMADWSKRPLSEEHLAYAINDTKYLIKLVHILDKELEKLGRLSWVYEEFKNLEKKDWSYNQGTFFDITGIKTLSDKERAIAYELYKVREHFAEKVNRPTHFIFSNKRLLEFSQKPIIKLEQWQNLKGVHPITKIKAKEFIVAILKGKKKELPIEQKTRKKYSQKQIELFTHINEAKDKISEKLKLAKHLIINKEQAKEIALTNSFDCLSHWQKKLIEEEVKLEE
jgi:ribonuclease D